MKINNKGYASTIIMFSVLTLFLMSMLMLVKTMNNSSSLNKKITEKVVDNIDYDSSGSVQDRLSVLENQLKNMENSMLDKIYPVGSVYISTTYSTTEEVKNAIGGTWEKYAQGRTIIGEGTLTDENGNTKVYRTDDNSKLGGALNVKLSNENLPNHTHTTSSTNLLDGKTSTNGYHNHLQMFFHGSGGGTIYVGGFVETVYGFSSITYASTNVYTSSDGNHSHTVTGTIPSVSTNSCTNCNSKEFSVQNPYIVTYMYKRVK